VKGGLCRRRQSSFEDAIGILEGIAFEGNGRGGGHGFWQCLEETWSSAGGTKREVTLVYMVAMDELEGVSWQLDRTRVKGVVGSL
jgi:hypothetical protein